MREKRHCTLVCRSNLDFETGPKSYYNTCSCSFSSRSHQNKRDQHIPNFSYLSIRETCTNNYSTCFIVLFMILLFLFTTKSIYDFHLYAGFFDNNESSEYLISFSYTFSQSQNYALIRKHNPLLHV